MAIPKYIYCNRTLWLLFNLIFTRFIANGTGRTLMLERCVYYISPPLSFPPARAVPRVQITEVQYLCQTMRRWPPRGARAPPRALKPYGALFIINTTPTPRHASRDSDTGDTHTDTRAAV